MENRCVICGEIIPEGTQVCSICWEEMMEDNADEDNKIGKSCI